MLLCGRQFPFLCGHGDYYAPMAYGNKPVCRYHPQSELVRQIDPLVPESNGTFVAPTGLLHPYGRSHPSGRGYFFEIWKCPQCSYIELHDFVLPIVP